MEKRKSLSNIIRNTLEAPKVFVGEKRLDFENEKKAHLRLSSLFPTVSVITDADGSRFIPIQQITLLEQILKEKNKKSFDNGHKQGYDKGLQEGLTQAKSVLKNFENAIKAAVTQREAMLDESRDRVLELVIKICRKISYDAIEVDPEKTLQIINGVINSLVDKSNLKIKVNPQHLPIVEQNINSFSQGSTLIKQIEIIGDDRVKFGGCFIETPTGDIDARLNSQIDVIEDLLHSHGGEE